jgi:hypothetical protein
MLTFGARSAANPINPNSLLTNDLLYMLTMSLIWILVKIFPQFTYSAEAGESFLPRLFELTDLVMETPSGFAGGGSRRGSSENL